MLGDFSVTYLDIVIGLPLLYYELLDYLANCTIRFINLQNNLKKNFLAKKNLG